MDKAKIKKAEEIFQQAVDLPPQDRQALIARQCAKDPVLSMFVERLLSNDAAGMGGFMCTPPFAPPPEDTLGPPGLLPKCVGRYEIVSLLGEGGMGVVYEARQEQPQRTVALKVIRSWLPSTEMLRRFQREADVLGQLQHPGIACIYEAGIANAGGDGGPEVEQPFFAMELVRGSPLTDYVSENNLPTRARLELMAKICDAVDHAHKKSVIHRDLKPGNILIDQAGQPKILDFGVARVTDADIQTVTMQTSVGQLVGTVPYMSPEQVSGDFTRLDARSDVYALGVILYELLSGRLPYDVRNRSIPEAVRIIRDEEPSRLSSKNTSLRGDLETIVAKACEKERNRRYQSAAELASDLQRYLQDEPIVARPPSRMYQLRKFAVRNKGLVAGLAAAFVALLLGLIGTTMGMLAAASQRDDALAASAQTRAVSHFLHNMLGSVAPSRAKGEAVTVREILDQASDELEQSFVDRPSLRAALHRTIGDTYHALGEFTEAQRHFQNALNLHRQVFGDRHPEVAASLHYLGLPLYQQGDYTNAERLFREALEMQRSLLGPDDPSVATTLNDLAALLCAKRDYAAAEPLFREALAIRRRAYDEETEEIATSLHNLGAVLETLGDAEAAEPLFRESLEINLRLLGPDNPGIASIQNSLARFLERKGKHEEAEQLFRDTSALRRKLLGDHHPEVASSLNNLANFLRLRGDYVEAEALAAEGLSIRRAALPPGHQDLARSLRLLGQIVLLRGKPAEAEPLLRECIDIRRQILPEGHYLIADTQSVLGEAVTQQGRYAEAEPLLVQSYEPVHSRYGPKHRRTIASLTRIVDLYEAWGKNATAAQWRERLQASSQPAPTPDSTPTDPK